MTRDSLSSAHSLEREEDRYTKQGTQQAFVQLDNSPPTQYPRPDQYTTMEHIPEWFDPVATLSQCTHDGRHYFDEANYFSLEFPKGAIPERETVMIDIGVALDGPFLFPEGLRPMSPVFWLCVRDKKHFQFSQPVKVTIRCYENTSRLLGITVLMRKHEEISEQIFQLEAYSTTEVKFMPGCECGEFYTDHFGTICIGCPIDTCLDDNTDRNEEHEVYPRGDSFPSVVPQSSQTDYEEWHSPLSEEQNVLNSSDIAIGQGKVKRRNRCDKGDMESYIREEVKDGMEEYAALTRDSTSQQEYDMEHPILLPTPGPPIDPHNTREYIPEWISPVATLSQCTHDGRYYYDKVNNFSLEIPEGAILAGEYITIDIGVALYGPFQYPEGLRPISPVFWLCVRDKNFFQFLQPVRVTIPHFLNLENHNDIESLSLAFLKGDHEMNAQQLYQFQQAEGDVLFEPLKKHGVIQTTHFCYLCITSKISLELIQKAMFCIYAAIPQAMSHRKPAYVYFFVTFLLPTCLDTLKNQIRKIPELQDHIAKTQDFRFSKCASDPALGIILSPSTPPEWTVGLQFNKEVCILVHTM